MKKRLAISNARIIFRNFSGKEDRYNKSGNRNFCVILSDEDAKKALKDNWNVKYLQPKDEGDDPTAYIPVTVSYKVSPPKVFLINSKNKVAVEEETIGTLDWVDIANVDLVLNPYEWDVNGKTGVKAYLKSLYITVNEDDFERKYSDLPFLNEDEIPFA